MTAAVAQELPSTARRFVRALWGLDVSVLPLPAAGDLAPRRPRFLGSRMWLPTSSLVGVPGSFSNYLLAATAHAAAHQVFGRGAARFVVGTLKPAQVAIISLLEDARVERLASERYPGLTRLWAPFHEAHASGAKTSSALFGRLARALHDDAYVDDDGWVSKARESFFAARESWHEPNCVRDLGGRLGNDLGQMRVQFNARDYLVQPAYRDDNVGLWQFEPESAASGTDLELEDTRRPAEQPLAGPDARERGTPEPANADASPAEEPPFTLGVKQTAPASAAFRYPEWDYVIRRERPAFSSLREKPVGIGEVARLDAAMAGYAPARRRLQRSALRLSEQRPVRLRRLADGDRLDLPAAIATVVARVSGERPDPRVYRRVRFRLEPPAVLLLLDCSASLNTIPPGASSSALEQARCASALLAMTLQGATRDWAIHGFSSNGRDDVGYFRYKDFDEPCDERVRARLAGMRAGLSTRLGTALRHAGHALNARHARRKLLLVVSDGEPSDVDVHDSKYLLFDAKQATQSNRELGVASYCLGLDSTAESSLRCIFGRGNYVLTDRLDQLPEVLGRLYLRLAG
ncbi:MAG: nitric oxide reductase activation protein NorD [Polyangiaceae bacterium]